MTLNKCILIGLLGSFLMFLGDMTLYYDPNDYDGKDTINNIIGIMKNVIIKRLYIGGLLGPICAFIYCNGFYHIVLSCRENNLTFGWIVFLINVLGMIFGGAYHIQCTYLGLLSRHENKGALDEFLKFLKFQAKIVFWDNGTCKYRNSIVNCIWIYCISKLASFIYTYISFDFYSSC